VSELLERLAALDLDALEAQAQADIKSGKKTARPKAIKTLRAIRGLRRNNLQPKDLVISSVPVIPPEFRPFSVAGETFIPGDANEVYRDILEYRRLANESEGMFGKEGSKEARQELRKAVKAAYGFGESPNPKTRQRRVKGFFQQATGTSPKTSWVQSKLLSKPQDNVGRATVIPNADLGMNEIEIPEQMGWKLFQNYVQRRLVQGGMNAATALSEIADRTPLARKALETEMSERPVVASRAPSWHKFNTVGQYAKLHTGDAIRVNTFITDGQGMDFDGDQINVSVPVTSAGVDDIKERLMADKMLWSIKDREQVMPGLKHEQLLGLSETKSRAPRATHNFATPEDAERAVRAGAISMSDEIQIGAPGEKAAYVNTSLSVARRRVNTDPSEAQKKSENYKKGHIKAFGFNITLENPKGSYRSGVDASGNAWSTKMHQDYGYLKQTLGADGDHIDVFLGPDHESTKVYVVNQYFDGKFDEHKVMLGFTSKDKAKEAYLSNYDKDWDGLKSIVACTLEDFTKWVKEGDVSKDFEG